MILIYDNLFKKKHKNKEKRRWRRRRRRRRYSFVGARGPRRWTSRRTTSPQTLLAGYTIQVA
jgi:hypothetical protein